MTTTAQTMTAEELLTMPPDHQRRELIRGELRTMAPANSEHGATTVSLTGPLHQHVKSQRLGVVFSAETGFIIARNPDTVRAPDIAFVSRARIEKAGIPPKFWPGAPDLAVEVISPSDTIYEVEEKVQMWLGAGTQLVWVVNPKARSVTIHRPDWSPRIVQADDALEGDDVVPGFRLVVSEIFVNP
jgi:Uma2 family endonuclease